MPSGARKIAQGYAGSAIPRQSGGNPPASTVAAQIVENLTQVQYPAKQPDKEEFQRLLHEILNPDDDGDDVAEENIEINVDVNCRLIYVVVRAGLESLSSKNSLDDQYELHKQAIASLSVVQLTLRRSPEVLFSTFHGRDSHQPEVGPLYLWLIPRLFIILGSNRDEEICRCICEVLKTASMAEKASFKQIKFKLIQKYLQGCIKDLLVFVEGPLHGHGSTPALTQWFVPTMKTVMEVQPMALSEADLMNCFQVCVNTFSEGCIILGCLLSTLALPEAKAQRQIWKNGYTKFDFAWILSCLGRLWNVITPKKWDFADDRLEQHCVALLLEILTSILGYVAKFSAEIFLASKATALLSQVVRTVISSVLGQLTVALELSLSSALLELARAAGHSQLISTGFQENLLPFLRQIKDDRNRWNAFTADLQNSVFSALCSLQEKPIPQQLHSKDTSFRAIELQEECQMQIESNCQNSTEDIIRPNKRPRISVAQPAESNASIEANLLKTLHGGLNLVEVADSGDLSQVADMKLDQFLHLSEDDQIQAFLTIGQLACAKAQTLLDPISSYDTEIQLYKCSVCDVSLDCRRPIHRYELSDAEGHFKAIANLYQLAQKAKLKRPRIAAILAMRRLLSHFGNLAHLDISTSLIGRWCLQGLKSSMRDLRIASGRTLPVFLQDGIDEDILSQNRARALNFLRSLSDDGELAIQETCVLAWGQIAWVSSGDEMNVVLLRLVEFLGHTNPLICGVAYDQISKITKNQSFEVMRLFMPYWRTIAPYVVKDLLRRPQVAQHLSDLLAMSVSEFLCLTQVYTIPFLVLTKKRDILQKIADACGRTIMPLCMDHNNMAAILSCILLQSSEETENVIMALFSAASPDFNQIDHIDLIRAEPILTASELLKAASEDNPALKSRAHQALYFLATITHGRPASSRSTARKADLTGPFFETYVLGIMAHLADTINDGKGPQPVSEKRRCLGGIGEMIRLAEGHISNGLPQICACLRSAIENPDLSDDAFSAWIVMISTLGEEEIGNLVDPTFAIIAQHWELFSPKIQAHTHDAISRLLKTHSGIIRQNVRTIPSLASIPLMAKFEEELGKIKAQMDIKHQYQAFSERCQSENVTVVVSALKELETFLIKHQRFLHEVATQEQPDPVVAQLIRSILDACVLLGETHEDVPILSAKCLGLIGCVDPTRIEAVKDKKGILVLSNFGEAEETKDFVVFAFREVLVKSFLSAISSRSQGFLAWAMQELLQFIQFDTSVMVRSRNIPHDANYLRWMTLPESVRNTLTPFMTSKYVITEGFKQAPCIYPLFRSSMTHQQWLRTFTLDLLQKGEGENIAQIFHVFSRIIRTQDVSISDFILPFAALNMIINGAEPGRLNVTEELLHVLNITLPESDSQERADLILCSQNVFHVLDYLSRWMQEKKKEIAIFKVSVGRSSRPSSQLNLEVECTQVHRVEEVLNLIPADVIARRAVECKSFARALFHWEQYIRQQRSHCIDAKPSQDLEPLYERLQDIYTQIDEPDGIEGISAHLQVLNIDQQILEHRKAGRWTAVQSWYELLLTEKPNDNDVQLNLLTSLKESGQHDVLLNQIDGFQPSHASSALSLPFAVEASWVTGKWAKLRRYLTSIPDAFGVDFNIGIGKALLALSDADFDGFNVLLDQLRRVNAKSLSATNTMSLQICHSAILRFHAITEVEAISGVLTDECKKSALLSSLNKRLDMLGAYLSDKQYLLGLRRATMQLSKRNFSNIDISSTWLTSAKLARKAGFTHSAFNAVLHASQLGDVSATIEHSRLLWKEGHHRKAIQSLEGAIAANAFRSHDDSEGDEPLAITVQGTKHQQQNLVKAKAYLLLAKWVDRAGQTQSDVIISQYKNAIESANRWEKGHYYLGKHYNKLLESEKAKQPGKQAQTFITGETGKLVVENYLRSLAFGAKYIYQTLPRILTLWLEIGSDAEQPLDPKYGNDENFRAHMSAQRRKLLGSLNGQMRKYIDRLPPFVWYTAFSQIVARICHSNKTVYGLLVEIVTKVVIGHPQQAIWTLLAVVKSSSKDRAERGNTCLGNITETAKKTKSGPTELLALITQAQKLSDQLLHVCEGEIQGKATTVSITRDLRFNHKTAPCKIAIPLESMLTASLPSVTENVNMKAHKPFPKDVVTISTFMDEVSVLQSLQRPRKISIRGSDGNLYALLCKPKDDLRKDQRLMEFNGMINRALKRDAKCSERRLYIKTYAVTPLNEECGLIEWVDKLKTLRDILLKSYKQKNVVINYGELRTMLAEASSDPNRLHIFTDQIISKFPPAFHEWFVEMFPELDTWFAARLRYTRSCAVMSIVGHVLGLGDRHGENILFEEGNGGTFHVDFNCLFDKGLTFERPEVVPFRLTHNMVDAFGAYGYEGPFRKSCELTLNILQQHQDTLMTILETFLYDPTTDFIGKKKKKQVVNVPDTPEGVLESVHNKVRGLLPMESVPLSVEGYVQELIRQATDPLRLASMYIGWCAFF